MGYITDLKLEEEFLRLRYHCYTSIALEVEVSFKFPDKKIKVWITFRKYKSKGKSFIYRRGKWIRKNNFNSNIIRLVQPTLGTAFLVMTIVLRK
jgi:hypothetical protein